MPSASTSKILAASVVTWTTYTNAEASTLSFHAVVLTHIYKDPKTRSTIVRNDTKLKILVVGALERGTIRLNDSVTPHHHDGTQNYVMSGILSLGDVVATLDRDSRCITFCFWKTRGRRCEEYIKTLANSLLIPPYDDSAGNTPGLLL